jgi:hypothetical protein
LVNSASQQTLLRSGGTTLDVPGNRMGYSCVGFSGNNTGSLFTWAICHAQ